MDRHGFEVWYAASKGQTVEAMRSRGWYSAPHPCDDPDCPQWEAIPVPPDATPEQRKRALAGVVGYARFGDTPPVSS